ncbi:MAG: metallophosphoesterase family protein [Phycisphaerales bacterium]|nr:metallophosphoesterase family protein [Planctomycetota bacterium]MCH8509455.1 metallophosphoesterase family protein [Phycisphaerales bacterium]
MRVLCISDLHADLDACGRVVERSGSVDAVVLAGDFARQHRMLTETIDALRDITTPCVLVPGNNERPDDLVDACLGWKAATVLHGSGCVIDGVAFWGLGAGVPVTPFGAWSYDLTEDEARALLAGVPEGGVLVSHSPPKGHGDRTSAGHEAGSVAVLEAIERARPALVVCGHIHDSWGYDGQIGPARVTNAGPKGMIIEVG